MQTAQTLDLSSKYGIDYQSAIAAGVPQHTVAGIRNYIEYKTPPGSFIRALMSNSLSDAMFRADQTNRAEMYTIVQWVYCHAPQECWGTTQTVENWLTAKEE